MLLDKKVFIILAVLVLVSGLVWLKENDLKTSSSCFKTGCSGQICADENVFSACEFRPEYACYSDAQCERQSDGGCGWTITEELRSCLDKTASDNSGELDGVF